MSSRCAAANPRSVAGRDSDRPVLPAQAGNLATHRRQDASQLQQCGGRLMSTFRHVRALRRQSAGSPGYATPAQPGRRRSRRTKPYPVTPPSRHCRNATSNLPDPISFRSRPVRFSHLLTTAIRSHTPRTPRLGASKPIRHKPVEAHMLFGSFADKATVNLCRDTHHEPA